MKAITVFHVSVLCILGAAPRSAAEKTHPALNRDAPKLSVHAAIGGNLKHIGGFKGKVTLVQFWAIWCIHCEPTYPRLRRWKTKYGKDGLEIIAATTYFRNYHFDGKRLRRRTSDFLTPKEERKTLRRFATSKRLNMPIAVLRSQMWKQAEQHYQIDGLPVMAIIDRSGVVRKIGVGSQQSNADSLEATIKRLLRTK